MKILHIYNDSDGRSCFEDIDTATSERFAAPIPVKDVQYLDAGGGEFFRDFHSPRHRQMVILLSGSAEYETSDGEVRRCGPGSIIFAEDMEGRGHISRSFDEEHRRRLFIHLD
jgi:hypothetical protein